MYPLLIYGETEPQQTPDIKALFAIELKNPFVLFLASIHHVTDRAELCKKIISATKYFQLAGMSIQVNSELSLTSKTFANKFDCFEIDSPLNENIVVNHHFSDEMQQQNNTILNKKESFKKSDALYFRPPWAIYQIDEKWIYQRIEPKPPHRPYYQTVITNKEHTYLDIYNDEAVKQKFLAGNLHSITMFPTDQILTGRLLSYKNGCIMHSLGVSMDGSGFMFVGHSDAGKSTMATILADHAKILCDDRNIIRKQNENYYLSGTWSHGDVKDVSADTVPLKGIFFLQQATTDRITPLDDQTQAFESLLACLIRPLETRDWWEKSLDLLGMVSEEVPCYALEFTKTGKIIDLLKSETVEQ